MRVPFFAFFLLCIAPVVAAQSLQGRVVDADGSPLSHATISIRSGATYTTNAEGFFDFPLPAGSYTLQVAHVGYERQERSVTVPLRESLVFRLRTQALTLETVVVANGPDPAIAIMRKAIAKRDDYVRENGEYSVEVYTKGLLKLRGYPKKFMGQKIDFEDGDTSQRKVVYLSEVLSQYSVRGAKDRRVDVKASKVSGERGGYGFAAPTPIRFYSNAVKLGDVTPRGIVSPLANNAFSLYNFRYGGTFFEGGKEIHRINVSPKRSFEPVFTGWVNIVEGEWRLQSLRLEVYGKSGLEMFDTVRIEQSYKPLANATWGIETQTIYPAIKILSFDAHGSFVNVYRDYDVKPAFAKNFFDKTVLNFTDTATKHAEGYWDGARPVALEKEEILDYRKKDSLEVVRTAPAYKDSIDRIRNKVTIQKILLGGLTFSNEKNRSSLSIVPVSRFLSYNTVEGAVVNASATWTKNLDTGSFARRRFSITPELRYGFSNGHFNPNLTIDYSGGRQNHYSISVSGGSDVFQFNPANPQSVIGATIGGVLSRRNNLKIYEARYGTIDWRQGLGSGLRLLAGVQYQDRIPLENTTDWSIAKEKEDRFFTPNRADPRFRENIPRHQAVQASIGLSWQPGVRYVQYPGRRMELSSRAPRFSANLTKGIPSVFGSDVDFLRWQAGVTDNVSAGLFGEFEYNLSFQGFFDDSRIEIPDYIHFRGNPSSKVASAYTRRFLFVPHYYFSNHQRFSTVLFTDHHFNGFITNKIPGLKKWKWNLVAGANALAFANGRWYVEPRIGIDNIFKVLRLDYIVSVEKGQPVRSGLRLGLLRGQVDD